jgi:hypothetical protein
LVSLHQRIFDNLHLKETLILSKDGRNEFLAATPGHQESPKPPSGGFLFGLADEVPLVRITSPLKLTNEINQGYPL